MKINARVESLERRYTRAKCLGIRESLCFFNGSWFQTFEEQAHESGGCGGSAPVAEARGSNFQVFLWKLRGSAFCRNLSLCLLHFI